MVYLFLAEGFEDMEAVVPFDLMKRAGIEVETVGIGGKTIKSAHGLSVIADISEEEVKCIYSSFVKNQKTSFTFGSKQADKIANPILTTENADPHRINDLIMQIAFSANIYKRLIEKITEFNEEN